MGAGTSLSVAESWNCCGLKHGEVVVYSPATGEEPPPAARAKREPAARWRTPATPRGGSRETNNKRTTAALTQICSVLPPPSAPTQPSQVVLEANVPVLVSSTASSSVRAGKPLKSVHEPLSGSASPVPPAPSSIVNGKARAMGHVRFSSVSEFPMGSNVQTMKEAIRDETKES